MLEEARPNYSKMASFVLLLYLYLTIPVQGNFLFRHRLLRHLVLFCSVGFFLFTLRVSAVYYAGLIVPVVLSLVDELLRRKRGTGVHFMVFEIWGVLMGCAWIINLMLLMMDILLFLSNIFGVSILLFTCTFIAVGNNIAGGLTRPL